MAFVPVVISNAVGDKFNGRPAKNDTADVKKVQGLLKAAFGSIPTLRDGVCDDAMKACIAEFQKLWGGGADSTVAPGGPTLRNLNRMANPLVLKPISQVRVAIGGYLIGYQSCDNGPLPGPGKGYTLLLCINGERNSVDVTDRPAHDLMSFKHNLGKVLNIFETLGCWAAPVQFTLQLRYKGALVSTSNQQSVTAPVQPHNGIMLPLDEQNNGLKLTYQGDPANKDFHGRMFAQVPEYDKNVFVWAGQFETNNEFRGFDCITYAGTTCGASVMHMADSADLASSLGATTVEYKSTVKDPRTGRDVQKTVQLEDADPANVKEYFGTVKTGYYLIFTAGHIVIYANDKIYEFKASAPSGYARSDAAEWLRPYTRMKMTVRKLPQKPARAV